MRAMLVRMPGGLLQATLLIFYGHCPLLVAYARQIRLHDMENELGQVNIDTWLLRFVHAAYAKQLFMDHPSIPPRLETQDGMN